VNDPTIAGLATRLRAGALPADELRAAHARIRGWNDPALFIHLAEPAAAGGAASGPLAGVALAVKDNIDVAGMPTTAGCPQFAYQPLADATVVARLRAAGAVPVGKANLDQFATGLVGVRSPHGVPRNPWDAALIPGGSSSGSACAVAAGLVPAALGTDTAGSGRVPAACTSLVGLKPTRGWLSTTGVVPAVRSLDCVSVFAHTVADAWQVATLAAGFDASDPFSRRRAEPALPAGALRIGVPGDDELEGVVDAALLAPYRAALAALAALGHRLVPIDYRPFREAADLLYGGAWVAERTAAVGDFLAGAPAGADPTVAGIVRGGHHHSALAAWRGTYRLAELARLAEAQWQAMDALCLPTIATHPTVAAVRADPLALNSRLGRFTNFANLLDTCALALPAGLTAAGMPAGITLFAPAWHDGLLARVGHDLQLRIDAPLGATGRRPSQVAVTPPVADDGALAVALFGAHLSGQPLNPRLVALGGRLAGAIRTAAEYRCVLLPGTPARPGLVRVAEGGAPFAGELWRLPAAGLGRLMGEIAPPLGLGTVRLDDGRAVIGFLCEAIGAAGQRDITAVGSWAAFLGKG
jgi:allophanate hydrolase